MPLGMEIGLGPGHTVLHGEQAPPKKGTAVPIFVPCLLWPNGWMDQDAMPLDRGVDVGPGDIVLDGDPAPPKRGIGAFRPMSIAAKRLDGSRCHLVQR